MRVLQQKRGYGIIGKYTSVALRLGAGSSPAISKYPELHWIYIFNFCKFMKIINLLFSYRLDSLNG
jgi:hypothetical protein